MKNKVLLLLLITVIVVSMVAIILLPPKMITCDANKVDFIRIGICIDKAYEFREFIVSEAQKEDVLSQLKKIKTYKVVKAGYSQFPVPESDGYYWVEVNYENGTKDLIEEIGSYLIMEKTDEETGEWMAIIGEHRQLEDYLREIVIISN